MQLNESNRRPILGSLMPLGLLALSSVARAQGIHAVEPGVEDATRSPIAAHRAGVLADGPQVADRLSSVPIILDGVVLAPDGAPAVGAVVVSSAGGQAVTQPDGAYRLEFQVPVAAESVQLTAVGGVGNSSLVASTSVRVLARSGITLVAPLVLVQASTCQMGWLPTFGPIPGFDGSLKPVTVFDDGTGPALYAGGSFTIAGGLAIDGIAKWNGTSWSSLGTGIDSAVNALTVFDDGSGPALYVGGEFTTAGGVAANYIAKWNGTSWSALGSGMNSWVYALKVFDDGSGPALYAGGWWSIAGGVAANRIAKWNGTSWSALGSGINGTSLYARVFALEVFDDGSGPALYAGGEFSVVGGEEVNHIARWNGTSWSALGSGIGGGLTYVSALAVFDDGSGPALYAGGHFFFAGGVPANQIAKWNGTSWSTLGSGMFGGPAYVSNLTVFDDGAGPALCAGGNFAEAGGVWAPGIAEWNGTSWSALGSGMGLGVGMLGTVGGLTVFDDGSGAALYAGGLFKTAGGVGADSIAKWNGTSWSSLAINASINDYVSALAVFDDGSGPALHAAGRFTTAGSTVMNRIAKWNGTSWSALGSGMSAFPDEVKALAVFDDGSGPALYAGGFFNAAGGVSANRIAKWNGTSWSALGSGLNNAVFALTVFDDGGGPALYASGWFTTAGGAAANRVAKWNGSSWSALGSGMSGGADEVRSLTVFDDGGGPALYAGGVFTSAGGLAANRIAQWNGSSWSALGSGMAGASDAVKALTIFDDGSGMALYAGGFFAVAGGVGVNHLAKWNGTSWSALGSGMNGNANALTVFDDGGGRALYAGGSFTTAGGVAANRIAEWNGASWSPLGSGTNKSVNVLAIFDDGSGAALYAGGLFTSAFDSGDCYVAKWGCAHDTTPPVLSCPVSVLAIDAPASPHYPSPPGMIVTFSVTADDDYDPSPSVDCVPPSGSFFPRGSTLVNCTATDLSGNQSTCQFVVTVTPKVRAAADAK